MISIRLLSCAALAAALPLTWFPGGSPGCATSAPALSYRSTESSPYFVGPMAGRPSIGDVNGDRIPDVVVACGTCCGSRPDPKSGHIMVLLGDGKGDLEYVEGSPIKIGSSVRKIALGDLNRDGRLDLVAAQHDSYDLVVMLGDGKGHFAPAPGSPVVAGSGGRPHTHEIALVDVNGDRKLDMLSTNANDNMISVLLGDGTGRFTHAAPITGIRHPYDALATADLNDDGFADVVVPSLAGSAIAVLLGNGKGGFAPAPGSPFAVGERPGYVATGDFDGDGDVDVCATHDDVGMVDVLLNDGKGSFAKAAGSPVMVDAPVWGIAVADLNVDGKSDLALGSMGKSGPVVLLGDGKGGFAEAKGATASSGDSPNYVAVADLDRDGRPDIVSGNYGSGDVSVYLGR